LRIVALGGLGEIGRNMTVFEYGGRLLIVDCGVLFPEEHQPGIDLILPDFDYIRDRLADIDGLLLTHAHEDHIGAVPYLLRERADIPVFGSTLTLGLLAAKLREHRIKAVVHEVEEGQSWDIGPFAVEFIAVNHSIPDALAIGIETPAGVVLHTGDFKLDQLPLDGRITDLNAFARYGDDGVDLLMVDSTNAEVKGFVTSEREIGPAIDSVFLQAEGRIIVACFASHIHRVQQVIDAAHANGRRVAFVGRSMVRVMGVARDLGYLKVPGGILVNVDSIDDLPADEVVLVCTGSQGEPMAVLSRIANRDHRIRVGTSDTILLASSMIPGNENAINRVINGLSRWGAKVIHTGNALVHVSGHAASGELMFCYNIVKPRYVMPVHGEVRHQLANAVLAVASGVKPSHVVLAEDGSVVDLVDGVAKVTGRVHCGFVFVDGSSVGDLTETSLKDRRVLGEEGFVSVIVAIDVDEGKIVAGPEIHARGFAENDTVFDAVRPKITERIEAALADDVTDSRELQQIIRRVVGRWVSDQHRRRPMIVPIVIEA
jgi:ribonuclease J